MCPQNKHAKCSDWYSPLKTFINIAWILIQMAIMWLHTVYKKWSKYFQLKLHLPDWELTHFWIYRFSFSRRVDALAWKWTLFSPKFFFVFHRLIKLIFFTKKNLQLHWFARWFSKAHQLWNVWQIIKILWNQRSAKKKTHKNKRK